MNGDSSEPGGSRRPGPLLALAPAPPPAPDEPSGPLGPFVPRAEPVLRVLARITDLLIAGALMVAGGEVGTFFGVTFLLVADALFRGQSPGKKAFGIKVIDLTSRRGIGLRRSLVRNAPLALAALELQGASRAGLVHLVAAVALLTFETRRAAEDAQGRRGGDLLANTQVIDGKVVLPGQMLAVGGIQPATSGAGSRRLSTSLHRAITRPLAACLSLLFGP